MNIYIYRNYVSDNEEIIQEKIEELIAENVKDIDNVESLAETEWDNVEEAHCSCKMIFDLMREGYIFLDMCGKE